MKSLIFLLSAFVVIALPSCSSLAEIGEGVSGSVYYFNEDLGAKGGLEFSQGTGRVFARKDIIDPATGRPMTQIEFEKRFGTEPVILVEQ